MAFMGSSSVHQLLSSLSLRFDCHRWYNFSAAAIASEPRCICLSARVRFSLCPLMDGFTGVGLGFCGLRRDFPLLLFRERGSSDRSSPLLPSPKAASFFHWESMPKSPASPGGTNRGASQTLQPLPLENPQSSGTPQSLQHLPG